MDRWVWTLFFLFLACAELPVRLPASYVTERPGLVDPEQSLVRSFPKDYEQGSDQSFYLELKDSQKQFVDSALGDIAVISSKTEINFSIHRLGRGRYEVKVINKNIDLKKLKFMVQKKAIRHTLQELPSPSKKNSQLKIISLENHEIVVELILKDRQGKMLDLALFPELLIEGEASVNHIKSMQKGIWHFRITYPDYNQIFYFSVRANGVKLERLLRFQHIEK
jgi:hypothetical protein